MLFSLQDLSDAISKNPILAWSAVAALALGLSALLKLSSRLLSSRLRRRATQTISIWSVSADLIDGLRSWVLFLCLFYGLSKSLDSGDKLQRIAHFLAVAALIYQIGLWGLYIIRSWRESILDKRLEKEPSSAAALGLLMTVAQIAFITFIVLLGLSNLGVNITALLAGLGVGGIAVALAAQNVLGDLLASLSIVLDKPFVVGDFIVAGDDLGTIERIGIKTTRIRALSGEELILSNKDLLESRIKNYKRMWRRRVVQNFRVSRATQPEVLERIPGWVQEIIESDKILRFDRCHVMAFGPSSLDFEFVFYVESPEYNVYMDAQQTVLLRILRKFKSEYVSFAFPTQLNFIGDITEFTSEPPRPKEP